MARIPLWRRIATVLVFASVAAPGLSLSVTENSPCKSVCDGSRTIADDLICSDSDYNSTSAGISMKNCLLCESTSTTYSNATDNDVYWFIFNMKYTIQHCLYEEPSQKALSPCEAECLPLQSIYKTLWWGDPTKPRKPLYEYCSDNDDAFGDHWKKCTECMRGKDGTYVLGNFISTMESACEAKPNASDGENVHLKHPLFMTSDLPTTSASSTSSPTATASETSTTSASADSSGSGSSGLSTGAKAGIGVGVAVGTIIIIALIAWFLIRRRRKQQTDAIQPTQIPTQEYYDESKLGVHHPLPQPVPMHESGGIPRSELQG